MAKFFFDVRDGELLTLDLIGVELDRQSVSGEARRLLLDISRDLPLVEDRYRVEVSVRDDTDLPIHWSSLLLERRWL